MKVRLRRGGGHRLRLQFKVNLGGRTLKELQRILFSAVDRAVDRFLGPRPQPTALLTLMVQGGQFTVTGDIMELRLGDSFQVDGSIQPLDSKQNPVPKDQVESYNFTSSDENLFTVVSPSPDTPDDKSSFRIIATGPLGSAQFNYGFDAQLGEGDKAVSGTVDVTIIPGEATGAGVTFGAQVPQGA